MAEPQVENDSMLNISLLTASRAARAVHSLLSVSDGHPCPYSMSKMALM